MLSIDRRLGQALYLNDTKVRFVKLIDENTALMTINGEFKVSVKLGNSFTVEDSELIFMSYREFTTSKNQLKIKARFGIKGNAIVKRAETLDNNEDNLGQYHN